MFHFIKTLRTSFILSVEWCSNITLLLNLSELGLTRVLWSPHRFHTRLWPLSNIWMTSLIRFCALFLTDIFISDIKIVTKCIVHFPWKLTMFWRDVVKCTHLRLGQILEVYLLLSFPLTSEVELTNRRSSYLSFCHSASQISKWNLSICACF